ncbi:ABC transporter ATP-binding protein [Ferdinandcohnia quinoae]|uniref:ABC transporter ATP-binding protein n=1 Tax=Fredinandcohnia quinoae TaxID=2918902 RepID=A0AAW5DZ38_9BACI|nr:ABC transporter ATP-binding protein [Fredinandcohnia sp. SECRCQ15]MCH1625613.1 ABC transporter ATP-binding protein [Fredinandcohnia sp. SECRCQ15]
MQAINITNLSKTYGSYQAVKNLNLTVEKGELFAFLGPNGAGKTTTIKMMTGLLEPTNGSIEIGGINVWQSPIEAKKKIAYVPDQPNLYPKLTGWEFLQFIASVFQIEEEVFKKRADELLRKYGLIDRSSELIEGYSHGMKQKIALCGALIHNPDVLFLDEPTVGLDPKSAKTLKNHLREICNQGTTVFLTTHILEIAEQMCDRVGIIRDGTVIALGTIKELRELEGRSNASLEDIFLELTGDEEAKELIQELSKEEQGESK